MLIYSRRERLMLFFNLHGIGKLKLVDTFIYFRWELFNALSNVSLINQKECFSTEYL